MFDTLHITRQQSFLIAAALIGIFIVIGVYLLQSKPSSNEVAHPIETDSDPDSSTKNVITLSSFQRSEIKDGKKVWDITAEKGRHIGEDSQSFLDSPFLTIYNDDGSTTTVKSESATLFHSKDGLEKADLFDKVHVVVNKSLTLDTDKATFFVKNNLVQAPGFVDIKSDGITIKGNQLEGDLNTNIFKILSDVDTVIDPRK